MVNIMAPMVLQPLRCLCLYAFVHFFMTPTDSVLAIAPKIIGTYGVSYLLLTVNIFLTYYFQAILRAQTATVISVGRGLVISSVLVMALPMLFGGNAVWYAMLVTEGIVAVYGFYHLKKTL